MHPVMIATLALAAQAAPDGGTATVKGRVTWGGRIPVRIPKIPMTEECRKGHPEKPLSDRLVVDKKSRALKWAFVYVKEGVKGTYPVPKEPVVLDQVGCVYTPHVFGVRAGQTVRARNSDAMLHNVHYMPFVNRGGNCASLPGSDVDRRFEEPEVMILVKCDVHPWMKAYAGVVSHPFFAVTGADGAFEIKGLPPGTYTLAAWHEAAGEGTRSVEVKGAATVDFTLKPSERKKE